MTIYEADVPGVGKKFEIELTGDERLVIILHHDGKREVHHRLDDDTDAERLFTLSGETARQFGAIMEGSYFQPIDLEDTQVPLGDSFIEWVDVPEGSPLADETLHAANVRQKSGASVIAIQRGEETLANPRATTAIKEGDILVAIGGRDEQAALAALVDPNSEGDGGGAGRDDDGGDARDE